VHVEIALTVAPVLPETSRALAKLIFGDNKPVSLEVGMTEADTSGAGLGPSGATVLSAWVRCKVLWSQLRIKSKRTLPFTIVSALDTQHNEALSSLNLANNNLGAEGAKAVAFMLTVRQNPA
jgi:hypothetical protein